MSDQRQHPRFAIELDTELTIGGISISGRTHDISRGGFCMLGRQPVPVPGEGHVKMALVFSETEFSEHLTLPATTVWCTPFKSAYQIGIKFSHLDAQSRGYLDLFIKFLNTAEEGDDEPTE